MPFRSRTLLVLFLLGRPLVAAEPPFATELAIGFGYEGSAMQRPVVVLDGTPSSAYEYSADGRAHTVDVAATRWFSPVGDDDRTPFALLPYVARSSSATARFALTGTSRDSFGSFSGQESSLEVRLAGDGSLREADLSAEWFFGRSLAVRGSFEYGNERETAASTGVERPSGRADVSTAGTRSSSATGSLGLALRLGEHEVSATGSYGESDQTRDDASAFTGSAQPFFSTLTSEGIVRRATLGTRLLFFDRRLAVDASASTAETTSSSDLATALSGPFVQGRASRGSRPSRRPGSRRAASASRPASGSARRTCPPARPGGSGRRGRRRHERSPRASGGSRRSGSPSSFRRRGPGARRSRLPIRAPTSASRRPSTV
ncbi:MAG: hypothetical protein IPL90_10440 [Holophagales bacterium]|nr:hypothetical protein [Holophagales bacterium]